MTKRLTVAAPEPRWPDVNEPSSVARCLSHSRLLGHWITLQCPPSPAHLGKLPRLPWHSKHVTHTTGALQAISIMQY